MPKRTATLSGLPLRDLLTELEAKGVRVNMERTDREGVWKIIWWESERELELTPKPSALR